jgi:hypothetical protein
VLESGETREEALANIQDAIREVLAVKQALECQQWQEDGVKMETTSRRTGYRLSSPTPRGFRTKRLPVVRQNQTVEHANVTRDSSTRTVIRVLAKLGGHVVREGKHTIMAKGTDPLLIPRHNPIHAITLGNSAKVAGVPEEFR